MCILIHIFRNLQQQVSQRNAPHPRAHSEAPNAPTAKVPASPNPRDTHKPHRRLKHLLLILDKFPTTGCSESLISLKY